MGRDEDGADIEALAEQFQSTRPVWGATHHRVLVVKVHHYFNPRAPYGARPAAGGLFVPGFAISIHAPRMGRDHAQSAEVQQ